MYNNYCCIISDVLKHNWDNVSRIPNMLHKEKCKLSNIISRDNQNNFYVHMSSLMWNMSHWDMMYNNYYYKEFGVLKHNWDNGKQIQNMSHKEKCRLFDIKGKIIREFLRAHVVVDVE